jgi:polyribonucleotide nucleotidyltransferase
VQKTSDVVKEGDKVKVKLLGFDDRGKTRLSMKVVDQQTGEDLEAKQKAENTVNWSKIAERYAAAKAGTLGV